MHTDQNYKPEKQYFPFKVYLGKLKDGSNINVYLTGFKWDCGWYWGGGYIETVDMHTHFGGCFLDTVDVRGHSLGNFVSPWYKGYSPETATVINNGASVWEDLSLFLDFPQFTPNEWWRIKDLYKQFYIYRDAAEAFQYGGHCASEGRASDELKPKMAALINKHIETVIIPETMKALKLAV